MTYKILAYIDLILCDHDIHNLRNILLSIKKDKFEYNERIVVLHNDTEYFYYGCLTGFTTYNFFNLVKSLDLPHYIFIFLTNYSKYLEAITPFITCKETVPEIHNTIVNHYSFNNIINIINLDDPKDIKYHGVCLLGTVRSHRIKLFQFFSNNNINNIRYTFNNPNAILSDTKLEHINFSTDINDVLYSVPHRINDSWAHFTTNALVNSLHNINYYNKEDDVIDAKSFEFYKNFAVDIVAETVFDYPHVFVSEKTLRPILLKTPFIMFGAHGSLEYLKSFGFKTFSEYWDESYDTIIDPGDRFEACCKTVSEINNYDLETLIQMYNSMRLLLEHNRDTLIKYIDFTYKPLYNSLNVQNKISHS